MELFKTYDLGMFQALDKTAADPYRLLAGAPLVMSLAVSEPEGSTKVEWDEDTSLLTNTTLSAAISTTDGTSISVTSAAAIQVGDIILVDNELMHVTAKSGSTLTVARGIAGTTAATHSSGALVIIAGNAQVEGAESPSAVDTAFTRKYNYMQEVQAIVHVTDTALRASGTAGDLAAYKRDRKYIEHLQKFERMFFYQVSSSAGSDSAIRLMKGISGFLTSHKYAITDANLGGSAGVYSLTLDKLNRFLARVMETGGSGIYRAYAGPTAYKAAFDAMRGEGQGPIAGQGAEFGFFWTTLKTEHGVLELVYDRHLPTGTVFINDIGHGLEAGFSICEFNKQGLGIRSEPQFDELAKTGASKRWMLLSNATLKGKLVDQCCGMITGITSGE